MLLEKFCDPAAMIEVIMRDYTAVDLRDAVILKKRDPYIFTDSLSGGTSPVDQDAGTAAPVMCHQAEPVPLSHVPHIKRQRRPVADTEDHDNGCCDQCRLNCSFFHKYELQRSVLIGAAQRPDCQRCRDEEIVEDHEPERRLAGDQCVERKFLSSCA